MPSQPVTSPAPVPPRPGNERPTLLGLWNGVVIRLVEVGVIRRTSPITWVVRRYLAADLEIVAQHFDAAFYLRQIRSPGRLARVMRDPLLHYLLIGWRERRSPNPRLDPRFYRSDVCADRLDSEPLLHISAQPDPAGVPQNEVEAAAPPVGPEETGCALVFHHARGGGSSEFIALFETALRRDGIAARRLRLVTFSDRLAVWTHDDGGYETIDLVADPGRLTTIARGAGITHVVVNHFVDFHDSMPDLASRLARDIGAPLWLLLHDYYAICPRINLIDADGRACASAPSSACPRCVADGATGGRDGETWRRHNLAFLERADRLIVPSDDMRTRIGRFVDARIEVWTPETDVDYGPLRWPALTPDDNLRIVILGSVNLAKGSKVVLELAREIRRRKAPVKLTIIGYAENARELKSLGVDLTGRYRPSMLAAMIETATPHLVLLPFIWPETWSFALTNALKARLPVALFAHGAPAERLARLGCDELVMPVEWIDAPDRLLQFLLDVRRRSISNGSGVGSGVPGTCSPMAPSLALHSRPCYARPGVDVDAVLDTTDRRIST